MLTGREHECQKLKQMLEDGLKKKNHLSIYISGAPGTGKTATTKAVLNSLKAEKSFHLIFVNCVSVSRKTDIERAILTDLGQLPRRVVAYSSALTTAFSETKNKIVVVLDEIDHLMSRGNDLLYSAFAWSKESRGNVIVVGIANSIDLTERLVPKLKQQGIPPKCFVFHPYNKDQLIAILKNYLTEQTMDEKSIELCARKVASQTGDIRMALSIANKVLQEIEEEDTENKSPVNPGLTTPKKNSLRAVMKVFNQVSSSPAARATLPEHSKIILAVLIRVAGKTSSREMTKPKLIAAYDKACKILKISAIEGEEWIRALENLETMGIVRISGFNQGTKIKFVDEIEQARAKICDHALIASIEDIVF